jgi:hypothetical protein
MSMPKRVRARTWRPPLPRPAGGPDAAEAARRVARAGRAAIRRQHPSSPTARRGRSLPWRGELTFRAPTRHRAPDQQPGRILIPGDGAAGDQEAQNRPACPGDGGYATPAPCPVTTTSWRYGLRRTCRLVTGRSHRPRSTWPDQARLAFLAVTHRYKRIHCPWLEQFQIAEYFALRVGLLRGSWARRSSSSEWMRSLCGLNVWVGADVRSAVAGPGSFRPSVQVARMVAGRGGRWSRRPRACWAPRVCAGCARRGR